MLLIRISYLAVSDRTWWKSKVCRWPPGETVRAMAWLREPLPVPDSTTTDPGLSSN